MANEEKKPVAPQTKGAAVKRTDKKLGFFKRVAKWFREMKSELKKVVWPTPKQTANNTAVCLVVMVVSALVLWGFDSLADQGVQLLLKLGG